VLATLYVPGHPAPTRDALRAAYPFPTQASRYRLVWRHAIAFWRKAHEAGLARRRQGARRWRWEQLEMFP
jgi:hypothetical protein